MEQFYERRLSEDQIKSIEEIYEILFKHFDHNGMNSINSVVDVSISALARFLAPIVPPQSTDALGDAIGHSLTKNIDAIQTMIIEESAKELN